jgi:anti-sigma regulatory factor (Ser/Thr protein kinase)
MPEISTLLPVRAEAPAMARRLLSEFIAEALPSEMREDAALLTSEVVTNSVRHAGRSADDGIGMELTLSDDHLRVSVTDDGPGFEPELDVPPLERDMGGFGLVLVDRISDRWGVIRNRPNVVWFELDRRTAVS